MSGSSIKSPNNFVKCHACQRMTHIDLLDGKPSKPGGHKFDRLECPDCYGDGWAPMVSGQERTNSPEWQATRRARAGGAP